MRIKVHKYTQKPTPIVLNNSEINTPKPQHPQQTLNMRRTVAHKSYINGKWPHIHLRRYVSNTS